MLSLMNFFPQHGHHTFTVMQSKLFEFRCASWWTPCTRNRFPRIATSSEKVSLAQLFYSVHMFSYNIAQHISIVISNRFCHLISSPQINYRDKTVEKNKKICGFGSDEGLEAFFWGGGGHKFQIKIII